MGRRLIFTALYLGMAAAALGQNSGSTSTHSATTQSIGAVSPHPATAHTAGPWTITKTEGRHVLAAISTVDADSDSETDCSHLVHAVYEKAGFPYDYANSGDLYIGTGTTNFTRVHKPQAGDLVVWRGHVGIVSDPKEHSFFSFTRTGPDTQFYDSAYWLSRGSARFYRYLTGKPLRSGKTLEATRRANEETLGGNRDAENRPPSKLAKPVVATNAVAKTTPSSSGVTDIPGEVVLQVAGKNPVPDEIASAFAEMNLDSVKTLRMRGLDGFGRPVVIYREIRVSAVEIKGKHGAALLSVESLGVSPGTQTASQVRWEELTLEFEKTKNGWVLSPSQEAGYISREAALQVLSARLADLTRNPNPSIEEDREKKQIIRFLNLLVSDESKAVSAQSN